MTDTEAKLLAFCLDHSFVETPEMAATDPIGVNTLSFLRELERLRAAVLVESAGPEVLEFVRSARVKRDAGREEYNRALAQAKSRWGTIAVDRALQVVWK